MARGDRFAKGRPPTQDAEGRSLPSDRSMRYVALALVCKQHPEGEEPELARFWAESHHERFSPELLNGGTNRGVTTEVVTAPDGSTYFRYKLRCPKCRNAPEFLSARIEEALEAIYEQGAYAKVQRKRV